MATESFVVSFTTKGTKVVQRNIDAIGKAANRSTRIMAVFRNALVGIAAFNVLTSFTRLVDVFTQMNSRLRLVTNTTRETEAVFNALFNVSERTRSSLEGNVDLFFRISRATIALRLSFGELIEITEILAQTMKVSGATAQEARNALIQFGQGLSAGAVRGDELRSVVEGLPALASLIGDAFGKSGGALIAFSQANPGILTTAKIIEAIRAAAEDMGAKFDQVTPTISDAFDIFRNRFIDFIGNANKTTKAAEFLSKAILLVSANLDLVAQSIGVLLGLGLLSFITSLTLKFAALSITIASLALTPVFLGVLVTLSAVATALAFMGEGVSEFDSSLAGIGGNLEILLNRALAVFRTIDKGWELLGDSMVGVITDSIDTVIKQLNRPIKALNQVLTDAAAINPFLDQAAQLPLIPEIGPNQFSEARKALQDLFQGSLEGVVSEGGGVTILENELTTSIEKLKSGLISALKIDTELFKPEDAEALLGRFLGKAGEAFDRVNVKARNFFNAVSPSARFKAAMEESVSLLNELFKAGEDTPLPVGEALRRTAREASGVGNAVTDIIERGGILTGLLELGTISMREFALASSEARTELADLNLEMATTFGEGFANQIIVMTEAARNGFAQVGIEVANIFGPGGTFQKGVGDGVAQAIVLGKSFKDVLRGIGQQILTSVISSLVQVGIQMGINKLLGSTLLAATVTENVVAGTAVAAAWAPAAAAASVATAGGAAASGFSAAALAIAGIIGLLVGGVAATAFADGGLVRGPGGPRADMINAQLSNGEFVVNAAATRDFLPQLEALNNGRVPAFAGGGGNVYSPTIQITTQPGMDAEDIADLVDLRLQEDRERQRQFGGLEGSRR